MNSKLILIIYYQQIKPFNKLKPLRNTVKSFIECFKKFSNHIVFYHNACLVLPENFKKIKWDLVVFHTTFLITRYNQFLFKELTSKLSFFKNKNFLKVAIPQDEGGGGEFLCKFLKNFRVTVVFTQLYEDKDIKIVYKDLVSSINFEKVLSGYTDNTEIKKFSNFSKNKSNDFIYRTFSAKSRNGSLGYKKILLGEFFLKQLKKNKFKYDISVNVKDTLFSTKWIKSVSNAKYTIGVEGGSSLYDPVYRLRDKCLEYEKKYPMSSFQQIEKNCFKGLDKKISGAVITPRMFEAAMAKTCMLLVEGKYNGILIKNVHYIPIKNDLSNIQDILKKLNEESRKKITERCYKDLIISQKYSYENFTKSFFKKLKLDNLNKKKRFNFLSYYSFVFFKLQNVYCTFSYLLFKSKLLKKSLEIKKNIINFLVSIKWYSIKKLNLLKTIFKK